MSDKELSALYGESYFHGNEYSDYTRDKEAIQRNFTNRLKILGQYTNNQHKKIFEIGCAYGFFLDIAQHKFHEASGVDISADAIKYATYSLNLNASVGNYLEMNIPPYDICCMWDTIEHLRDPNKFIEKISLEISQDGLLAITTGDIGSLNARFRGRKWRQIHPPTHLHYFCIATLEKLLNRFGFDVVHVCHPSNLINISTAMYITLVIQRNKEKLYRSFKRISGSLSNFCLPVNLGDIMYVIAQKKRIQGCS